MKRPVIDRPVIVEGKYDKAKIASLFDCFVITTEGFGIFKDREKALLLKKAAEERGIIILTDSDGAGAVIRNHLKGILPPEKITNLYIPQVEGKEKRKKVRSKEGFIGVEGTDAEILYRLFGPYTDGGEKKEAAVKITKGDFYRLGLSGGEDSAKARKEAAARLGLPSNLSANAMIDAINTLGLADSFLELYGKDNKTD